MTITHACTKKLEHTRNNILGKCFCSCSSFINQRISPLTIKYECPQLSLLIITSALETNKIIVHREIQLQEVIVQTNVCLHVASPLRPLLFQSFRIHGGTVTKSTNLYMVMYHVSIMQTATLISITHITIIIIRDYIQRLHPVPSSKRRGYIKFSLKATLKLYQICVPVSSIQSW